MNQATVKLKPSLLLVDHDKYNHDLTLSLFFKALSNWTWKQAIKGNQPGNQISQQGNPLFLLTSETRKKVDVSCILEKVVEGHNHFFFLAGFTFSGARGKPPLYKIIHSQRTNRCVCVCYTLTHILSYTHMHVIEGIMAYKSLIGLWVGIGGFRCVYMLYLNLFKYIDRSISIKGQNYTVSCLYIMSLA